MFFSYFFLYFVLCLKVLGKKNMGQFLLQLDYEIQKKTPQQLEKLQ